jgi:hypothetical protein
VRGLGRGWERQEKRNGSGEPSTLVSKEVTPGNSFYIIPFVITIYDNINKHIS